MALVVLGAGGFILSQRNATTPVTMEQSLQRFRADTGAPPTGSAPAGAAEAPVVTDAAPAPRTEALSVPAAARRDPFWPAAAGVYTYATTGGESVSFANAKHDYPSETFARVRHQDGCRWTIEHAIVEEHLDERTLCSERGEALLLEHVATVTFFGQRNRSAWTCEPTMVMARAGDRPGSKREFRCTSEDGESIETVTFLGRETVEIDGGRVRALHVLLEAEISGRAEGTGRAEMWLHPESGLSMRTIRSVETQTQAFGTTVTYREDATFTLVSLTPRT